MHILLVEDEAPLARAVAEQMTAERHVCDWYPTLDEAMSAVMTCRYDLVLLDLQLPDGNGLELLTRLRAARTYTPVIILSARDKISDRIKGLNLGADDYLVKPFDLAELSARVVTVTRRQFENASQTVRIGELSFDLGQRQTTRAGTKVTLTPTEWSLLELLLRRTDAIVPRASLEQSLYAAGREVESNSIEAHVSRLRAKLGRDLIRTHRGLGYSIAR